MCPKHFLHADLTDNLVVKQHRQLLEKDIQISSGNKQWKVLSYYYSKEQKCFVLDIEEKNSTEEEGWNAVVENIYEEKNNKRSDGNKKYQKGWDNALKTAKKRDIDAISQAISLALTTQNKSNLCGYGGIGIHIRLKI